MTLHDATRTKVRAKPVRLPTCPLCGDMLLAPMMAEHVSELVVRNHWACECCGYTFRKSFDVQTRREAFVCNA